MIQTIKDEFNKMIQKNTLEAVKCVKPESVLKGVGVIVGRFQTPYIHDSHEELIDIVQRENHKVIILLGVSTIKHSRRDPLDFSSRQMMLRSLIDRKKSQGKWGSEFVLAPIFDKEHDDLWSRQLDEIVSNITSPFNEVKLYGGRDSFISSYNGRYKTQEVPPLGMQSATNNRIACLESVDNVMFRHGVINASYQKYPTCYQVVDIALYKEDSSEVALIQKEGDDKFRFPGGFSDPRSCSLETDVKREIHEELSINVNFDNPEYIGSTLIDDWRYRREEDKVKSAFFASRWLWGTIKAGDDAHSCQWVHVSDLKKSIMKHHAGLADMFINWLEAKKMPLYNAK